MLPPHCVSCELLIDQASCSKHKLARVILVDRLNPHQRQHSLSPAPCKSYYSPVQYDEEPSFLLNTLNTVWCTCMQKTVTCTSNLSAGVQLRTWRHLSVIWLNETSHFPEYPRRETMKNHLETFQKNIELNTLCIRKILRIFVDNELNSKQKSD